MSFLPSLSPGNVTSVAPSSFKYDITDLQWERPTEWLDLNVPDGVPEKIIGLVAVYPNSEGGAARNYVAFNLDTDDNSSYTVNWGDGNTETLASNVTHYHVYDYDDITSDTSTMKSTTFRGYRQAKFEVTLNSGVSFGGSGTGQINFDVDGPYTTRASFAYRDGPNILDLFVSSSNATTHTINYLRPMRMLEQLEIRNTTSNRLTQPARLYCGCSSLRSIPFVPYIYNSGTRDYLRAFRQCYDLTFLPDDFADPQRYWFKNPSRMHETFYRCFSLRYLPAGLFGDSELSSSTSFYACFYDCRNLRYIPYLGIRSNSSVRIDYMFYNCLDLKAIPQGFNGVVLDGNGIDRIFYGCRECYDFSAFMEAGGLDGITRSTNLFDMTQAFGNLDSLKEFPYIGQFTRATNVTNLFQAGSQIERFDSQYTELDFINATHMQQTFYGMESLKEIPPIKVSALSNGNSLFRTFMNTYSLLNVTVLGMVEGPSNGEYYECFNNSFHLQYIQGIDFSYANDSGDYLRLFQNTSNLSRINFPGSLREGNTKFNLTVSDNADLNGLYELHNDGTYLQVGGNGQFRRSDFGVGGMRWDFYDTSDYSPYVVGLQQTAGSTTQVFDSANWSSASVTLTFSPAETGFKYSVSLRYCPLNRDAMLEIFNQLCTITHSATLTLTNNSYTSDLTNEDKAIATNKGWTLSL